MKFQEKILVSSWQKVMLKVNVLKKKKKKKKNIKKVKSCVRKLKR